MFLMLAVSVILKGATNVATEESTHRNTQDAQSAKYAKDTPHMDTSVASLPQYDNVKSAKDVENENLRTDTLATSLKYDKITRDNNLRGLQLANNSNLANLQLVSNINLQNTNAQSQQKSIS